MTNSQSKTQSGNILLHLQVKSRPSIYILDTSVYPMFRILIIVQCKVKPLESLSTILEKVIDWLNRVQQSPWFTFYAFLTSYRVESFLFWWIPVQIVYKVAEVEKL